MSLSERELSAALSAYLDFTEALVHINSIRDAMRGRDRLSPLQDHSLRMLYEQFSDAASIYHDKLVYRDEPTAPGEEVRTFVADSAAPLAGSEIAIATAINRPGNYAGERLANEPEAVWQARAVVAMLQAVQPPVPSCSDGDETSDLVLPCGCVVPCEGHHEDES